MSAASDRSIFYTPLQRRLHWLVVGLLVVQYVLQTPMREALEATDRQETLTLMQFLVTTVHTWGGIGIAAVMVWRWQLRRRDVPLAGGNLSSGQESRVRMVHVSLYLVLILMAVTGTLQYYAGFEPAAHWHAWGKWLLAALVGIHVAGALLQLRHDSSVLRRMMGRDS